MKENKENKVKQWGRLEVGELYCYIDGIGGIGVAVEENSGEDDQYFRCGNYYHTEEEAEYFRDKQRLMNDIRQWKKIHDNTRVHWENLNQNKIGIGYRHDEKQLKPMEYMYAEMLFSTFFSGVEIAEACIETFRDEIVSVIERGESWE